MVFHDASTLTVVQAGLISPSTKLTHPAREKQIFVGKSVISAGTKTLLDAEDINLITAHFHSMRLAHVFRL